MCLTRIHGQCLKSTPSAVGNPLKNKGTPVRCHQIVNGESRRIW